MSFVLPPAIASRAKLAHVGLAVRDLDQSVAFYRDVLGATAHPPEQADGATIVRLSLGETDVELLSAGDSESPIGRFLLRRGPGIHHLCFRVADVEAALAACRAAGYELIDRAPRTGADGHRIAFVHPKSTAGILVELTD
jgi:methylmalonyl-CoA/ethylmalonyl-CoA epimerase